MPRKLSDKALSPTAISDKLGYTPANETDIQNQINNLIDSAPTALNTLNELAAALGDDANFASTVTNSLSTKAPIESPEFIGQYMKIPSGTTAERPTSPTVGMIRFNSNTNSDEIYINNSWQKTDRIGEISASGGSITTRDGYKYHKFTSSGTFTISSGAVIADVLIVAGGGGGSNGDNGNDAGAGGGGGGVYLAERVPLTSGNYTATVGAGGAAVSGTFRVFGNSGSNSSFGSLTTAIGGGGGGRCNANGSNGGSGGGAGGGGGGPFIGGSGTENQGFAGGTNHGSQPYTGAGGGGAGGTGGWSGDGRLGGDGGPGVWIWGSAYSGGGGGGGGIGAESGFFASMAHGSGGGAGAGDGGQVTRTGSAGEGRSALANTGSGGGGGGNKSTVGGGGGSGIIIVRYRI